MLGFTSGKKSAQSDDLPFIEITLQNDKTRKLRFPDDNKIDHMTKNRGDIWEFPLFFKNEQFEGSCVERADIKSVVVKQGGNNGWNIKSIVTFVRTDSEVLQLLTIEALPSQMLTVDLEVYRWIDGDSASDRKEFSLTLY